jgi:hypothetical protein
VARRTYTSPCLHCWLQLFKCRGRRPDWGLHVTSARPIRHRALLQDIVQQRDGQTQRHQRSSLLPRRPPLRKQRAPSVCRTRHPSSPPGMAAGSCRRSLKAGPLPKGLTRHPSLPQVAACTVRRPSPRLGPTRHLALFKSLLKQQAPSKAANSVLKEMLRRQPYAVPTRANAASQPLHKQRQGPARRARVTGPPRLRPLQQQQKAKAKGASARRSCYRGPPGYARILKVRPFSRSRH